jgi:hypothetical protein
MDSFQLLKWKNGIRFETLRRIESEEGLKFWVHRVHKGVSNEVLEMVDSRFDLRKCRLGD